MEALPESANLEYIPEEEAEAPSKVTPTTGNQTAAKVAASKGATETAQVHAENEKQLSGFKQLLQKISDTQRFLKSRYLEIIDASHGLLLRLRGRLKPPIEEEARSASQAPPVESRKTRTLEIEEEQRLPTVSVVSKPRSRLRSLFVFLLGSVISAIAGMIFSYTLLSTMIVNQARKIDDQMDEISRLGRQYSIILTSEARYRNENQACQKNLEEMELNLADQRSAEITSAQEPGATRYAQTGASVSSGNRLQQIPGGVVECQLGSEETASDLTRCINVYNRRY